MDISGINSIQIKSQISERIAGVSGEKTKPRAVNAKTPAINTRQTQEEVIQNIEEMLKFFESNSSVKFQYDKSIDRIIIQVVNGGNKEVIKQIPPEAMVRFLQAFNEFIGILVDKEI